MNRHLVNDHGITPMSEYLKEIVYGGVDGIVTTFAVVAGFAGATSDESMAIALPVTIVILFGLANLLADATSMALGNFLAIRADNDLYQTHRDKELQEIRNHEEEEVAETVYIFTKRGFSLADAKKLAAIYKTNESCWADLMMTHELQMDNPENSNPFITSIATFCSFVVFGFVPLIPYIFFKSFNSLFLISIGFTVFSLMLLGFLRMRVTRTKPLRSVGEILVLGSVAAGIAYVVGAFFAL